MLILCHMGDDRSKFAPDVQEDLVVYNELVLYSAEVLARGGDLRNHASASRTLRPLALEVRYARAGSLTYKRLDPHWPFAYLAMNHEHWTTALHRL